MTVIGYILTILLVFLNVTNVTSLNWVLVFAPLVVGTTVDTYRMWREFINCNRHRNTPPHP